MRNDPMISKAMKSIAEDETEHAALSLDVHEWLASMLSEEERSALREVHQRTLSALARSIEPLPTHVASTVGWPSPEQAKLLAAGLSSLALS